MTGRRPMRWIIGAVIVVAAAGLTVCTVGLAVDLRATVGAWLTMSLFVIGLPLGAMTILMIHMLTGGLWGRALRRPLRAITAALPLGLLLLLPVSGTLDLVFPWATGDVSALSETTRHKLAYLNPPFFLIRFGLCCVIWLVLAWRILHWTRDEKSTGRQRNAALGLILHGLGISVFSVDWMMSLEPEFYSTIYPLLEASAQIAGAYALAAIIATAMRPLARAPGGDEGVALSEDVANMLFGLVLLWVYLAFMQWLIVWAADMPIEIRWYLLRVDGGWRYVLWLLIALHFAIPLGAFLNRDLKRSQRGVLALGGTIIVAHWLDVFWRVRPPLPEAGHAAGWIDAGALLATVGLFVFVLLCILRKPERLDAWPGGYARA